jgi:hypothetical protein
LEEEIFIEKLEMLSKSEEINSNEFVEIDKKIIKSIQTMCIDGEYKISLDLVGMLKLNKSLEIVLQLFAALGLEHLNYRVHNIIKQRDESKAFILNIYNNNNIENNIK